MLGSAEEWFYRGLGGINVDLSKQGSDRLAIRPFVPAKIAWARARYQSTVGLIESDWQRGAATTIYDFTIPANMTATIDIDSAASQAATVNGVSASHAPGVIATQIDGNKLTMTVGSGKYEVRAENPAH